MLWVCPDWFVKPHSYSSFRVKGEVLCGLVVNKPNYLLGRLLITFEVTATI